MQYKRKDLTSAKRDGVTRWRMSRMGEGRLGRVLEGARSFKGINEKCSFFGGMCSCDRSAFDWRD